VLRVILTKAGLDPKRDVNIVEVGFASTGAAIRERRIDCGILLLPFTPLETAKGDLRPLVSEAEAFGPFAVIFQAARTRFLNEQPDVARAYLDDYVRAMRWFYDPVNRVTAVNLLADLMKTPREVVGAYFLTPDDYYRDPNGCVGVPLIQQPIDAMVQHGLLAQRVDMAQYVDLSYLPNPCAT
jgi:NitT/TauT family transport system substrate-binding protein